MSCGGTPYIGSKISLISKAKIRYEGYLYTIDTEESTVTLAKVKSFGTEDRSAPNRVPERNEIYEYIVFRGSDIDDLHVAECPKGSRSQVAEDPAIVQTGNTQPSMYQQQMQMRLGTPMAPQSYGPFGGIPPYGYPMGFRPQGNMPLSSVIGQSGIPDRSQRSSSFDQFRRSPSPPSAGVVGHRYHNKEKAERNRSPEGDRNVSRHSESQRSYDSQPGSAKPQREQRSNQRQKDGDYERTSEKNSSRKLSRDNDQQRHSHRDSEDTKEHGKAKDKDPPKEKSKESSRGPKKQYDGKESQGSKGEVSKNRSEGREKGGHRKTENESQKKDVANKDVESNRDSKKEANKDSTREGYDGGRGHHRPRGRGRPRGHGSNSKARFDKDFDFERANAKFNKEEVEKELLSALKKKASLKDDDDVIVEKDCQDDSHDEFADGEMNGEDVYYDKSKSFFDQISCDAGGPKSEGFSKRKERALNVQTFGFVPHNYRGRPYRGRGGRGSRGRGYGRGGQSGRTGRGGNRTWVDYDFDFEAAGIRQGNSSSKSGGS
ncbi:protein LSM14 homolog B-like [Rhopilema esculentum]|uniref:protein LSM14 homolog B-like n=1 Tax=Rhopilema esculentum TaxID=499914 RepID=UPI0031DBE574